MDAFQAHMRLYRAEHRTLGCKITHMFGVPMIAASIPIFFFNWPIGLTLFGVGWALQFMGHYVFEKNKPVVLSNPTNPLTYLSAIVFVAEEWGKVLTGKSLVEVS